MTSYFLWAALAAATVTLCAPGSFASSHHRAPSDHAPIGVMGDHLHESGEWMLSYRFNQMGMKGNRDGTDSLSTAQVHSQFMVAPSEMMMDMHMVGAMLGVSDDLTLSAMGGYMEKEMTHVMRNGRRFRTSARGLSDTNIGALYRLYQPNEHTNVLLNAGLSLPTGNIGARDATPMNADARLPYPMQLGSGTWDPVIGLTLTSHLDEGWRVGAQAKATTRFGENSEGYRLGNEYGLSGWLARDLADWVSVSFRLDGKVWGDISGRDSQLSPMMVQTARTDLQSGERLDGLLGVNLLVPHQWGAAAGNRFAIELGAPIYQRLDGPQMEADYRLSAGWQLAF